MTVRHRQQLRNFGIDLALTVFLAAALAWPWVLLYISERAHFWEGR